MKAIEDNAWLDERVRQTATEMLQVLFASSRIGVITFDARAVILGVNPQTAAFDGRAVQRYCGVSLIDHPILQRLGLRDTIERVLAGETVEVTDSRWVTLFSGEERYVDVLAGPVIVDGHVAGGIAYLVDATSQHLAEAAAAAKRGRARELARYVARDVNELVRAVETWASAHDPSDELADLARDAARDLTSACDDLTQLIRLETYEPKVERIALGDQVRGLDGGHALTQATELAVFADARLLRRVLRNMNLLKMRMGGGRWACERDDGRLRIRCTFTRARQVGAELVSENALSTAQEASAAESLAAARWMAELMHGSLTVDEERSSVCLELPAADPVLATGTEPTAPI